MAISLKISSSVQLLNNIRNKVEHEYAVPDLTDLQVYFELFF